MDFYSFPHGVMAREEKRIELKPVDDSTVLGVPVVRLETDETREREKPVRLGSHAEDTMVSRRLDLPNRDETESRTYQPGIEALIEMETVNPDQLEGDWGKSSVEQRQIPWGWFALIGLILAGAVAWSLVQLGSSQSQTQQVRVEAATLVQDDAQEELEAERLVTQIETTIRSFYAAKNVAGQTRFVRHVERVRPLMEAHHAQTPVVANKELTIRRLEPLTLGFSGNFWLATVGLERREKRNIIIDVSDPSRPLIDWETLVCYQPMPWDDFAAERPTMTSFDFRVQVVRDSFHSHEFSDSKKWSSFRLTALGADATLFGYAKANESVANEIQEQLNLSGNGTGSLILRLHVPAGLQSRNGVVIEKVVNTRWLHITPPDASS